MMTIIIGLADRTALNIPKAPLAPIVAAAWVASAAVNTPDWANLASINPFPTASKVLRTVSIAWIVPVTNLYPAQAVVTPTIAALNASTVGPPFSNHERKSATLPAPSVTISTAVSNEDLIVSPIWVVVVMMVSAVPESIPNLVSKSILSFSLKDPKRTSNIELMVAKAKFNPSVKPWKLPSGTEKTFSKNATNAWDIWGKTWSNKVINRLGNVAPSAPSNSVAPVTKPGSKAPRICGK